jgi:peptide chain release factor 2
MADSHFWDDQEAAQKVIARLQGLKGAVDKWEKLHSKVDDLSVMVDLSREENDDEFFSEVKRAYKSVSREIDQAELTTLLSGQYDKNNAILAIYPGAGGTESQDWAAMLLRMYTRWAEQRNFKVETMDYLEGDEAGIKSVTLLISGEYAYGYLRAEKGVHRLVRISPFDASGRRHTSFASLEVLPEIDDDNEIDINPVDLKIDTYRSGGAGGQHVNKTESAIRITHIPTGIVVQCQNERSQHSNKAAAMKILRAKLFERNQAAQMENLSELRGDQGDIAWGNQIRSYVFCPYTMVKDHRTDVETGNITAVMDGDLDPFIEGYLKMKRQS